MMRAGAEKEAAEWRRRWASHRKQEGPDYLTVWPLTFLICKIGTESQEVYRGRDQKGRLPRTQFSGCHLQQTTASQTRDTDFTHRPGPATESPPDGTGEQAGFR